MNKKKILFVITSLGYGGAERLLIHYVSKLNKNKYDFLVCSLRDKPDDLLPDISEYTPVIKLNLSNRFNPSITFKLIKLFKDFKPDLIHTHLFQPRIYATLAYLFYRNAILITQKHNNVNGIKHHIFIFFEMICISLNERVIAISESVKNSLIKFELVSPKKIFVLPNCIDYQHFNNYNVVNTDIEEKRDDIVIGVVGRLERQKGVKYLILAMKIILNRYPKATLDIIGDGSQLLKLQKLAEKIGISNSVKFFGKFGDVIPFYKKMDIFVLSSIYEGFGIVLLEAMATGVPVIATNVDGIKEIIIDMNNGILVPTKNPKAIADAITRIINDSELRKNLIDQGFKQAKLYDVKEHVMKLDNFYSQLLKIDS